MIESYEIVRTFDAEYFAAPLVLTRTGWECWSHQGKTHDCLKSLEKVFALSPLDRQDLDNGKTITASKHAREDDRNDCLAEQARINDLEAECFGVEFPDPC